ncbi:winged helix-turn-helix domain-containing protein [Serratia marcescens]|uniref:winged helix-turn-helix domain-containing protein n=1 Tax=Serratia marcescens TaxID=615 RepID=UPI00320488D0
MRYIINNKIKYHEDRSELVDLDAELPPQPLTATLNRLLSALVRNNNLVISRDTLLTQVWEAHGQVASGNNLNNTISILRKMFAAMGEDDIIVTLPRQGFMFTAASLETADSQAESLLETTAAVSDGVAPAIPNHAMRFKRLGLMALSIMAIGSALWAWSDSGYAPLGAISVGNIENCNVRFVTSFYGVGTAAADLPHLKTMLIKNGIQCQEAATVLYYDSSSVVANSVGRSRVSYLYYCPQSKMASGKAQCENIHETSSQ